MADRFSHQLADLLLGIEMEMRHIGLWETRSPAPEALASLAPFCHDTLDLSQWLQWVFLPKMKQALEQEIDMPASSDILPLATYRFSQLSVDADNLLELIGQFDRLINHNSNPT